jgi:hypothetical protein
MARYFVAMMIGGVAATVYGANLLRLAASCKDDPQVITGAQLQANGWGDNAHVEITNAGTMKMYLYQKDKYDTQWKYAFVPMVPLDGEYMKYIDTFYADKKNTGKIPDMPRDFCCILKISARGEAEVDRVGEMPKVRGVVINAIESLDKDSKRLLREGYPHVNLDRVAIVEFERQPEKSGKGLAITAGGGALSLCGLGFFVMWLRGRD